MKCNLKIRGDILFAKTLNNDKVDYQKIKIYSLADKEKNHFHYPPLYSIPKYKYF